MGYLEIYVNIRPLNSGIGYPFYHMYIDYFSKNSIATMHQSGLKPKKANLPFHRGYFPDDKNQRLIVSSFNKHNDEPIKLVANITFLEDGVRENVKREMNIVPKEHMVFQDISALFADLFSRKIDSPTISIKADRDMHRPNFYINSKEDEMSWIDIEHGNPYSNREERMIFLTGKNS